MRELNQIWQEFLSFNVPNLGTCFYIPPPAIFGVSIYQYIYLAVLFIFIIAIAYYRKIEPSLRLLLIFTLLVWSGLALKLVYDNFRLLGDDLKLLSHRSLEEKHILLTGGDYYQFLSWCKKTMGAPKEAVLHVPNKVPWSNAVGFLKMKGPYYLVPFIVKNEADIHLVYMSSPPSGEFEKFARYNDHAYILMRVK